MGIIGVNVHFGRSSFADLTGLPAVTVALSKAVIDKAYLTWLDIGKLQTAFPKHVQVLGDEVTLQGPVAIVSSVNLFQRFLMQSTLALGAGVISYLVLSKLLSKPKTITIITPGQRTKVDYKALTVKLASIIAGATAFYLVGRAIPTQAGIYFYKQPPFYV